MSGANVMQRASGSVGRHRDADSGAVDVNTLPMLLAVGLGGAIGALARFGTMVLLAPMSGRFFYAATLFINVLGSLALGLLYGAAQQKGAPAWLTGWMTGLLGVGVLGAFTTFSTFAVEVVRLLHSHRVFEAACYAVLSAALAIGAAALGFRWMLR